MGGTAWETGTSCRLGYVSQERHFSGGKKHRLACTRYCGGWRGDLRHHFSKMEHLLSPDTNGIQFRGTSVKARDCQPVEQQYLCAGEAGVPGSCFYVQMYILNPELKSALWETANHCCMRIAQSKKNKSVIFFKQFAHMFLNANAEQCQGKWGTQWGTQRYKTAPHL